MQELANVSSPAEVRHAWNALWEQTPRGSFRQSADFLTTFPPRDNGRWRLWQVSAWARPIGLIPLRERRERRFLREQTVLSMPDSPWGTFPGSVGPHPATSLVAVVRHLLTREPLWDMLELPEIVAAGQSPKRLTRLLMTCTRHVAQRTGRTLREIELPSSWSQFWNDRSAAARGRWRELDLALARLKKVQFVRFRPQGSWFGDTERDWSFLSLTDAVVRQRTEARSKFGVPDVQERLRELHPFAVDAGCADVVVLLIGSRPAAFAYNVHRGPRVETLQLLADPNWPFAAEWLIGQMLRDEIARGNLWHTFLPCSTADANVDWPMWQGNDLRETIVSINRRATVGAQLRSWLRSADREQCAAHDEPQTATTRLTSAFRC